MGVPALLTVLMSDNRQVDAHERFSLQAPCKVNLFLEILARRPDGYHDLETLMVAVALHDTLEFRSAPAGEFLLNCSDPTLDTGRSNLVTKAAEAIRRATAHPGGAEIRLTKQIPREAGLAGGSTDAATTLIGLNRLWALDRSLDDLRPIAAELGSDVAFFLQPPAAWCTGRGERVEPIRLGCPLNLVLVCPGFGCSTASVFRLARVPAEPARGDEIRRAAVQGDLEKIGRLLHNRLQQPACQLRPEIQVWLDRLAELNPVGRLMSGSGSTVFALARDLADAQRIAEELRARYGMEAGVQVHVVTSCD